MKKNREDVLLKDANKLLGENLEYDLYSKAKELRVNIRRYHEPKFMEFTGLLVIWLGMAYLLYAWVVDIPILELATHPDPNYRLLALMSAIVLLAIPWVVLELIEAVFNHKRIKSYGRDYK